MHAFDMTWFDMAWTAMAILSGTGIVYFLFVHRALVRWLASPEKREVMDLEIKVRDLEKELALCISKDPRFIRPQDGGLVKIRATGDMALNQRKVDHWQGLVSSAKQRLEKTREEYERMRAYHENPQK